MKRRDLLKTGLATIGVSSLALSGCSKNDTSSDVIIPKQTAQYEFSVPLPFDYKAIDELAELNSTVKKSKIKTLHGNIPQPLVNKYNGWVNKIRGEENPSIKTLDDFGQYVKYAFDKSFKFTYLMDSPKAYSDREFLSFKDEFVNLLEYLHKTGVKDIAIGNIQTIRYVNKYAPNEFNYQVSTDYDLRNMPQYNNLFDRYKRFNLINMAHDEERNFGLFKSLKKVYPNKKIEICLNFCKNDEFDIAAFIKSSAIYPWNLEYYSVMGINNFKFMSHGQSKYDFNDILPVKLTLNIIENGYENYTWEDLYKAGWICGSLVNDKNKNIKLSDIAPLFPEPKHFIKYGNKCDTKCKAQCNYCYECAKKLEKVLALG